MAGKRKASATTSARGRPKSALREKKGKAHAVKVHANPLKEYAATMKAQGVATISNLADDECMPNIRGRISTGSLALDRVLRGLGEPPEWAGIPLGRVTEIFGPPFIGKSTLLDCVMGECQRAGGEAVLADTEVSRDRHYTQRLGVDLSRLQYLEFDRGGMYLENVLAAIYTTIDFWGSRYPDTAVVIGLDALGGTATREEAEKMLAPGEKGAQPALAARVMHQAARLFPDRLRGRKIAVVILNHEYEVVGGFHGGFGTKKRETYGGSGVRHLGTNRIQLRPGYVAIKRADGVHLGQEVEAKLVKNRLGASHIDVRVPILSGVGVENVYTIFEDLKTAKIIATAGGWAAINLDGAVLKFQGWSGLKAKCVEDVTLYPRLAAVWKKVMYDADL